MAFLCALAAGVLGFLILLKVVAVTATLLGIVIVLLAVAILLGGAASIGAAIRRLH